MATPLPSAAPRTGAWSPVSALATAHAKAISSVKFSRDGAFVATASADSTVKVWSTQALLLAPLTTSAPHTTAVISTALADSPPPDLTDAQPLMTLRGHDQGVSDVAWSHDGAYLVSASDDRTLRVWELAQQKCVSVLGTPTHNSNFLFSGLPLETSSSSSTSNNSAARFTGAASSSTTGKPTGTLDDGSDDGHRTFVFCCEFNPQGSLIASGSFDETVRLWDVRTGRCLVRLTAHQEPVSCVDFNGDGTLLATASFDGLVRLWDVATMQCLREIILEPSVPATLARFTPNSQFLLIGTMDSRLSLWDFQTPQKPQCCKRYNGHVNRKYCIAAAFLQDEEGEAIVVSGSEDGRVIAWHVDAQDPVDAWSTSPTSASVVIGLSVHPSQKYVVTACERGLTLWGKQAKNK